MPNFSSAACVALRCLGSACCNQAEMDDSVSSERESADRRTACSAFTRSFDARQTLEILLAENGIGQNQISTTLFSTPNGEP